MVTEGQTIENPVAGDTVRFLRVPTAGGGGLLVEMTTVPGGQGPPTHVHPHSSETFTVKSGSIMLHEDGQELILRAGETRMVAAGVPHTFASHGDVPAVTEVSFDRPGRMADFLETFYELARAGRTDAEGKPSMLQIAVSFGALADDIRTVVAPWPAQRVMFATLGPVARARGLRPFYATGELTR
jgi:quercetin dioxygenase-like cupin family protein